MTSSPRIAPAPTAQPSAMPDNHIPAEITFEGVPAEAIHVLTQIQQSLKAPKSETNSYGGYNYRNIEQILEQAKRLAAPFGASVVCTDQIAFIGGRHYVKATVALLTPNGTIAASAYAREADSRKGMDAGQLTGACSSYARKYAAQGLFAISGEGGNDLDALPPNNDPIWPDGQFDAKCGVCGRTGHNLNKQTVETFRCPDCGHIDWRPLGEA